MGLGLLILLFVAPLDVVDDFEDEVEDEGEGDLGDEDALVVVEIVDGVVVD